jgi:hypothetical protein
MQTNPDSSPNEGVHAEGSAHVNINRFTLPNSPVQWLLAVAFVSSVVMNGFCCWWIYLADRDSKLKDYDVGVLQSQVVSPLQAQVQAQQTMLSALETRLEIREECKR